MQLENKVHFQNIADNLTAFETSEKDWILNQHIWDFNTWQLIRKPLYYLLKNRNYGITKVEAKANEKGIMAVIMLIIKFICKVVYSIMFKRNSDIIYANATYKLEKDENGKYVNVFLDSLITNKITYKYIYFETPGKGRFKQPPLIKPDIDNLAKKYIVGILQRKIKRSVELQKVSKEFSTKLNLFLQPQGVDKIKHQDIINVLSRFKAEYNWHYFLFRLLKANRVFIVDGMPTGVIAAAQKLGIPIHEFQHGFISHNKHDYMLSAYLNKVRDKLVLPNFVYVFGNFFRDQLLSTQFWKEEELVIVGNYRIEKERQALKARLKNLKLNDTTVRVLLATQLTTFDECKTLLTELAILKPKNILISIKCHPREPERHREWFKALAKKENILFEYINAEDSLVVALSGHHILASFHSTALLEALALGFPCVTIATKAFPSGVNNLLTTDLSEVIKPIHSASKFIDICNRFKEKTFKDEWLNNSLAVGIELYEENYYSNLSNKIQ